MWILNGSQNGKRLVLRFLDDYFEGETDSAGGANKLTFAAAIAPGGGDRLDRLPVRYESAALTDPNTQLAAVTLTDIERGHLAHASSSTLAGFSLIL